ncbi:MAG: glycosyltransferase family 2 protein, partial [Alphaproteobacteria bacterium]
QFPASSEALSCELTILMPCLDEAETVGICVRKAKHYLDSRNIAGEIVIADNGSGDGSQAIAFALGARVITVPQRGYGAALAAGIAAARGTYVIMGDADDSYDFSALDPFVAKLRQGCDLVMGNRFAGGIEPGAMPFLHKYLGNPVLSGLGRLFFNTPVRDFHCGLRGFRREAIADLGLRTTGMEFASEMVVKATLQKLRIAEAPTTLSPDGRTREPHLRSWRDGWRHLRFLLLFSPRWLFFYPGAVLLTIGLATMLWLLPGPQQIGNITLDIHTLAYSSAAIICGFQALAFAVFAKTYAVEANLMPEDPRLTRLGSVFSLEIGIVTGIALLLVGLGVSAYAVGFWGSTSFEGLNPVVSMRFVLPGITAIVLGIEVVFSSFFFSILGLARQ